jgi:hypothetical protein
VGELGTCVVCNKRKNGWYSRRAEGFVCRACYRREFAPREQCGVCGKQRVINARPDDVAHCEACYKRLVNRDVCSRCGVERTVHARDERKRPVCLDCYERDMAPREQCFFCGTPQPPSYRRPSGEAICRVCYHREVRQETCAGCGNESTVATRTPKGEPLCHHCSFARRPLERCPLCRERKPLLDCKNGERICQPCWRKHRQPRETCSSCGKLAHVAEWRAPDRPVCATCWSRSRAARLEALSGARTAGG